MQIIEGFENLRAELEPLVNSWQPKLEELWQNIREVTDKNKRYSYDIEYNRFKDLFNTMSFLKNDEIAVYANEKKIKTIRHELHTLTELENVGTEIGELIIKIESSLKEQPPNTQKLVSDIKRAINLIKTGEDVIPHTTRRQLIDRLNVCIIARNKLLSYPSHGIVIQLRENKDFVHCVAAICHVQCQECKHFMTFSGNTDCDIYAPIKCTRCKSFELAHYRVSRHEEFKELDEVAEVVDENTKPGNTRAKLFREWQAAFTKSPKVFACFPFLCKVFL